MLHMCYNDIITGHAWLGKEEFLWEVGQFEYLVGAREETFQKSTPTLLTPFGGKVGGSAGSLLLTRAACCC